MYLNGIADLKHNQLSYREIEKDDLWTNVRDEENIFEISIENVTDAKEKIRGIVNHIRRSQRLSRAFFGDKPINLLSQGMEQEPKYIFSQCQQKEIAHSMPANQLTRFVGTESIYISISCLQSGMAYFSKD